MLVTLGKLDLATSPSHEAPAALLALLRQAQADGVLTVDIHGPADVCAAQRVGDLAGDGLEEEGVIHDGFVEVTGRLLYNLAFFCPPVEEERVSSRCWFASSTWV